MRILAFAALLALGPALGARPALAQADANLAPGAIVDGARAGINGAEGTTPEGRPSPGRQPGEGEQAATSGSRMVKQGDSGAKAPTKAETPNKP